MNHQHLLLYSNCIPVKGASRSLIVDIQRSEMFYIDNHLYEILLDTRHKKWQDIREEYDEDSQAVVDKYASYLQENDLCFWTDTPESFPPIAFEWDSPSLITNAIIDVNASSTHDWQDLFTQLAALGCRDVQVRCFEPVEPATIEHILGLLQKSFIKSIEIIFPYQRVFTKKYLRSLTEQHVRVKNLILHGAPKDALLQYDAGRGMGNVVLLKQVISNHDHCGVVNIDYFVIDQPRTFAEYMHFNSCLNRKLGIDEAGNIKNCPSLPTVYGNTASTRLAEALTEQFKAVWQLNKDQVNGCKVCEYRYVCSDCRAYTHDAQDPFSKPKKCGYDPYTMEWR